MSERIPLSVVASIYTEAAGEIDNATLYQRVAEKVGWEPGVLDERAEVGRAAKKHNLATRQVRWFQQDLRRLGVIEKVPGKRGIWALSSAAREAKEALTDAPENTAMVAFSTELGVAIWSRWESVFPRLDEPLHFCISSPPYALRKGRAYGNPRIEDYVDFIVGAFEPVVRNLVPGGVIALNISADLYEPGLPARSLYRERLILALHEKLGLWKVDEIVWHKTTCPPGPMQWASRTRQMLNQSWEPVYVLTNDPKRVRTDNRRVLEPHSPKQLQLIAKGGEQRERSNSDGAYKVRVGSYGNATAGKIPRNVLSIGHRDSDQIAMNAKARSAGLPTHGAPMPLKLADFLVRYISKEGDTGADIFGGRGTTAKACELNNRRWIITERYLEYLLCASWRFPRAVMA